MFRAQSQGLPTLLAAVVMSVCVSARAEGPGIRNGDIVVHPQATGAVGLDSNVFYEDASETPVNATVTRVGLGVGVENRHPNKVALELGTDAMFRFLFADGDARTVRSVEARNGFDVAKVDATVGLLPRNPFTLELKLEGNYKDRPAFEDTTEGYQRVEVRPGFDLRFRPGENPDSRPLELRLGYRAQVVRLLDCTALGICAADKTAHQLRFLTSWKFFPKTALSLDARWTLVDFDRNGGAPVAVEGQTGAQNRDGMPVEAALALKGLVTRRISTTLRVGYKNTFNDLGESFSGVIATTEVQYALEPSLKLTAGYNRDARDSSYSNFYVLNQAYSTAELYFFGRWNIGGRFGFDSYDFSATAGEATVLPREDPVLTYRVHGGYSPNDWLSARLSFEGENNRTDFFISEGSPSAYHRTVALASIEAKY